MIQANKSKPKAKAKKATSKLATVSAVAAGAAAPRKRAAAAKPVVKAARAAVTVTPEERMKLIEQAAYFHAEKAGFTGDPHAHWVAAEAEVDALLKAQGKKSGKSKK